MRRALVRNTILAAAVALLATACSFTRLAYNNFTVLYSNAGPMLTWMVDDYVDISGDQKDWVRERFERALAWHRAQELPAYRRFLELVARRFEGDFSAEEVRESHAEMRAHYRKAVQYLLPDTADFLLQLDSSQVEQLERKLADEDRRLTREALRGNPEVRHRERMKKLFTHLEEWTGPLDDAQRELVDANLRAFPDTIAERSNERRFRQAGTLALIRARPPKDEMVAGLHRLMLDAESWRPAAYQRKLEERDRRTFEMIARLSATLAPAQRAHLVARLRGYVGDITTLTASR